MEIKPDHIPVFTQAVFDHSTHHFWMGDAAAMHNHFAFLSTAHRRTFFMLLFVQQGSATITIDNRLLQLHSAEVVCVHPNSVCSVLIEDDFCGQLICFTEHFFSLRYNDNVLNLFSFLQEHTSTAVQLAEEQFAQWKSILVMMEKECSGEQKGRQKMLRSLLNILLVSLDRNYVQAEAADKLNSREQKVIQFEKRIESDFRQHKNPSWYAAELNITANYLNRLCQDYRHCTSGALIRKRILIEAQRLLHHTSLSVAEIAYQTGFETPSYFITFFKKHTGVTPEQFRKQTT